jgi:hypothetical protein
MARISTDIRLEVRPPDFASAPIIGLDEKAVVEEWNNLKGSKVDFGPGAVQSTPNVTRPTREAGYLQQYSKSCSTVVLRCLEAGGLYTVFPETKFSFSAFGHGAN